MAIKEDTAGIVLVDQSELGTMNRSIANNRATQCRALVGIYCLLTDAPDLGIPLAHAEGAAPLSPRPRKPSRARRRHMRNGVARLGSPAKTLSRSGGSPWKRTRCRGGRPL